MARRMSISPEFTGVPVRLKNLNRNYESYSRYRYGFQGQEKDDEIKGAGNSINFKYRIYDSRLGRFFAIDPLTSKYPYWTPYSFSGNRVIDKVELEGLEPAGIPLGNQNIDYIPMSRRDAIRYYENNEADDPFKRKVFLCETCEGFGGFLQKPVLINVTERELKTRLVEKTGTGYTTGQGIDNSMFLDENIVKTDIPDGVEIDNVTIFMPRGWTDESNKAYSKETKDAVRKDLKKQGYNVDKSSVNIKFTGDGVESVGENARINIEIKYKGKEEYYEEKKVQKKVYQKNEVETTE